MQADQKLLTAKDAENAEAIQMISLFLRVLCVLRGFCIHFKFLITTSDNATMGTVIAIGLKGCV